VANKQASPGIGECSHIDLGERVFAKASEYLERVSNRLLLLKEDRAAGASSGTIDLAELEYWRGQISNPTFDAFEVGLGMRDPARAKAQGLMEDIGVTLEAGNTTFINQEHELFECLVRFYASCVVSSYTLQRRK